MTTSNDASGMLAGPPYAADDWKAKGYTSPAEEIEDMANVGRSLMERIADLLKCEGPMKGWSPMDDPAEIVTDMANMLDEAAHSPEPGEVERLREAAQAVINTAFDHYTARNGRRMSIEGDDGEKCWIVPFDPFERLRAVSTPTNSASAGGGEVEHLRMCLKMAEAAGKSWEDACNQAWEREEKLEAALSTLRPSSPFGMKDALAPDAVREAAQGFANAATRIDHYDGERFNAPLYAMPRAGSLRELLDGIDGEPLTVGHLRNLRAALANEGREPEVGK